MKVQQRAHLGYVETVIVFTKRERDSLRRASALAERAREMARSRIGPLFEDDDQDVMLAEIEHNAREYAEAGVVPLAETDHWAGPIDFTRD